MNSDDLQNEKKCIIDKLRDILVEEDKVKASESNKYSYCSQLADGQLLKDVVHLSLPKIRVLAQLRLNRGIFRLRNYSYILDLDTECTLCNMNQNEDLFDFIFECKIHQGSRILFLTGIPNLNVINRDNFFSYLVRMDSTSNVINYTICSLSRRKLMLEG